ncbi:MAG: D-cysteine desulfhydrase [Synergistaceae bacterium]|jgi:D-cysteine desulfhydrase|nr:D-cysteine desulfhydrase [Synergistaceae bacterium]
MNLSQYPRRRYTPYQTPIEELRNLSDALGGPTIYMKRDDLLGLAGGGNKTRKLEFLMADALNQGADTVITCGAVQSNHCRLTLAAAVKEGLKCHLVLEQRVPNSYDERAGGNNFLFHLLGAEGFHVVDGGADMAAEMQKVADALASKGRKPYIIPGGGSNEIGALGYVACAQELLEQSFEMGVNFDNIILTSGSTGTHAGVLTGILGNNANIPVTGIGINRKKEAQSSAVYALTQKLFDKMGIRTPLSREDVVVFDDYIGEGYSRPTKGMIEAVKLVARTEAILLDPVYTGKAMAGMIDLIKKGHFAKKDKILFLHTGGSPALYVYADKFFE